ncbi:MAG: hypothetical protein M3R65_10225 [Gemmatimonadota bacterium]|nr:hypothetical protein [Gemmatimonadota bacterium]
MRIIDAQRDVRTVFAGGFFGQLVSSVTWCLSAATATWHSPTAAIIVLFVGGAFIFPLTQLLLRLSGRQSSLPKGHPMNALAMQIAFTLPLNFPLIIAATAYRQTWFYPAFMIALGAHYLPFVFLYGMWQFAALAGLLVCSGLIIGLYVPTVFGVGGWVTAAVLLLFAFVGRDTALSSNGAEPRGEDATIAH